ncbi:MAG: universal stress protein [Phormidesmis sp.]
MFSKIMIALDTREACHSLFDEALVLAQATKAKLILLSVLTPNNDTPLPLLAYPGVTGYPLTINETVWEVQQRQYKQRKAEGLSVLAHFVDQAVAIGVQAKWVQAVGDPGSAICDCAQTEEVDLIMVGSHGRRGLNELLSGSVSSYVMHRACCSVLVVHEKKIKGSA